MGGIMHFCSLFCLGPQKRNAGQLFEVCFENFIGPKVSHILLLKVL